MIGDQDERDRLSADVGAGEADGAGVVPAERAAEPAVLFSPVGAVVAPEIQDLIAQRRYREVRTALADLPAADIAEVIDELEPESVAVAFRLLPRDVAGDVFADLDNARQEALIEKLGAQRARTAIEALEPDDRARLLDELPTEVATRLMASLSPQSRRETLAILGYPAESVGRLMTPNYVRVRPDWTVARALDHVRRWGRTAETIDWIYVIDEKQRLIGDFQVSDLLFAEPDRSVREIMVERTVALECTADREDAVVLFAKYDRFALPVVDSRGTLLGIVTADDVADVAEYEATEDIHKLGGMGALAQPYLQTALAGMLRKRGPWLAILFLGQSMTVFILSGFENRLAQAVVLTLFIPLIIACGGNSGTQTASLIIRALALREIEPADWLRILRRELATGILLGCGLGAVGLLCVAAWSRLGIIETPHVGALTLAVTLAILGVVTWGTLLGATLPLLLQRLGLDPATSSSPMIATLMDASGMIIYFSIAVIVLHGTLL